jgi:lysophospholipid hydrolase
LINDVSTGGTISSLFSILSLFTEDIKLSWTTSQADSVSSDDHNGTSFLGRQSRANSDVSQLDSKDLGLSFSPLEMTSSDALHSAGSAESEQEHPTPVRRGRSSSIGTAEGTARQESWSPTPDGKTAASVSQPVTTSHSPFMGPSDPRATAIPSFLKPNGRDHRGTPESQRTRPRIGTPQLEEAMKGSIARATVDSTLAVIPAEAFRKLTRKYPKATGSIVQVVLERFSRVTFMTGE